MSTAENIDKVAGQAFLKQVDEAIEAYCEALQSIREKPTGKRPINKAIQKMQIIKGAASFSAFHAIEILAQSSISVITALREKNLQYNDTVFKALVSLVKLLREQFAAIEKSGHERSKDYDKLMSKLEQLKDGHSKVTIRLSGKQIDNALGIEEKIDVAAEAETNKQSTDEVIIESKSIEPVVEEHTKTETDSTSLDQSDTDTEEENTMDMTDTSNENTNAEDFQFLAYKDEKALIKLGEKINLDNIKTLYEEIMTATDNKETIEVYMGDLQKTSTPLLQLLQSLKQYKKIQKVSFIDASEQTQNESQILGINLS